MVPTRNGRSGLDTWGSFPFLSIFGTTRHPNSGFCRKTVAFCTCGWEEYAWPADCSLSHNSFAYWFASFWSSLKMQDLKWWFDVVCYCLKKTIDTPTLRFLRELWWLPHVFFLFLGTTFPEPNDGVTPAHGGQDLLLPTEHTMSKLISSRQALVSGAFSKGIWANLQWL